MTVYYIMYSYIHMYLLFALYTHMNLKIDYLKHILRLRTSPIATSAH